MNELITTFHIDWKLLSAQVINFAIVLIVLKTFALKPLLKLMKDREEKIDEGLKNAEEFEVKLKEVETEKQNAVLEGRKEAQEIVDNSLKQAENTKIEKIEKTKQEIEKLVNGARKQIKEEREGMIRDVKDELGGLIAKALNKLTSDVIDAKQHKALIDDAINNLESKK